MERTSFSPTLVVVVCVLGFLVAVAFNTARGMAEARPERATDLAGVVRDLEMQRVDLESRLGELRDRMDSYDRQAALDAGVSDSYTQELNDVREAAGLTDVTGEGLRITLSDANDVPAGSDPNDYVIHDTDVSTFVNALFVGGAQAVDVNGERVVASTPIRCAGTTILVNSGRLGGPYTIRAVGDPETLRAAIEADHAAALIMDTYQPQYGIGVDVASVSSLKVPAYRGSLRPVYAQVEGSAD